MNEEQLRQLQLVAMQGGLLGMPQPQQMGQPNFNNVNVAENMMTPVGLLSGMGAQQMAPMAPPNMLQTPQMAPMTEEQRANSAANYQKIFDFVGNRMPAGDTFQRGNYIAGIDESDFKRPMSAGRMLRPNLGFPAY